MKEYYVLVVYLNDEDVVEYKNNVSVSPSTESVRYSFKDRSLRVKEKSGDLWVYCFCKYNPEFYQTRIAGGEVYCGVVYLKGNYDSNFLNYATSRIRGGVYDITTSN